MKRYALGLTLVCGLVSSAMAETYLGVGVGSTDYGIRDFDNPTGLNIYLGSKASDNLAIEAFYTDFGTAEDKIINDVDVNVSNFGAGVLMGAEAAPGARLFVQVGIHAWDGEVTSDFTNLEYNDSGSDIYYGFGGSFEIAPGLSLGARYTQYAIEQDDISLATINLEASF